MGGGLVDTDEVCSDGSSRYRSCWSGADLPDDGFNLADCESRHAICIQQLTALPDFAAVKPRASPSTMRLCSRKDMLAGEA